MSTADSQRMGFNATWSMAVGGMVGGGIFSVLGVVVAIAGIWAWLSFVIAGLIALATGVSYARLAEKYGEGGGAFTFLREVHRDGLAGSLSWVLIIGYVLTISVYGFTFGHYLNAVFELGDVFPRVAAAVIVALLAGVNLLGVGEASSVEIITVWGKLAVLVGLAVAGLVMFRPERLSYPAAAPNGVGGALLGAATIFMAYEGFQLLTYDYEEIREPRRTLPLAVVSSIITVIFVYVIVALGSASLVGAESLVEHREIALAGAGRSLLGTAGVAIVSAAAAFSTGSAINATLFATARLAHTVAADGELPQILARTNRRGVPGRAVLILGGAGATLACIGHLGQLVEAASLAFLFTFAVVNVLAARAVPRRRWVSWAGAAGATLAGAALVVRLARSEPLALTMLALLVVAVVVGRRLLRGSGQEV
jgi:amino acid transporter